MGDRRGAPAAPSILTRPLSRPWPGLRNYIERMRLRRALKQGARRRSRPLDPLTTREPLTARVVVRRIAAAVPDIGIATALIGVAANPALWETTQGTTLWRAALMEFWAIHAGGCLFVPWAVSDWALPRRALFTAGIVAAYSLVLGIASLVMGAWWPIVTFWALTCNRALDIVLHDAPSHDELPGLVRPWAGNAVLFCVIAAITGMLADGRQAVFAGAAIYYLANAVSELGGWWWVRFWER